MIQLLQFATIVLPLVAFVCLIAGVVCQSHVLLCWLKNFALLMAVATYLAGQSIRDLMMSETQDTFAMTGMMDDPSVLAGRISEATKWSAWATLLAILCLFCFTVLLSRYSVAMHKRPPDEQ